jgi:hypothetical protein
MDKDCIHTKVEIFMMGNDLMVWKMAKECFIVNNLILDMKESLRIIK